MSIRFDAFEFRRELAVIVEREASSDAVENRKTDARLEDVTTRGELRCQQRLQLLDTTTGVQLACQLL